MRHIKQFAIVASIALAGLAMVGCGDDDGGNNVNGGFVQIEQLARPGINELFVITQGATAGYNANAPLFTGVPAETVNSVVNEARTVFKALYLGVCLVNGLAALPVDQRLTPAGIQCHAVGGALFTENAATGVTLTADSQSASDAYADRIVKNFLPDVMRIDTSGPSGYLTPCTPLNALNLDTVLLCGGRTLRDDVIDISYDYLLAGAQGHLNVDFGFPFVVSDGVFFSSTAADNVGSLQTPVAANTNQFHAAPSNTFPYSAPPL